MTEDWLLSLATAPGVRADPGAGVPEDAIVAAEAELGIAFPRSYRVWLGACNGTWIGGGEIFGLAPAEFADAADTDIRYRRRLGDPWEQRLRFYAPTDDEWWEFDFTRPTIRGEVLIVAHDLTSGGREPEEYAESFSGFVVRRLAETRPSRSE
jgi:hypothetical protein